MVGTGKLLAAGHMTSCCPAYISGRKPVSPPLESCILRRQDVRRRTRTKDSTERVRQATDDSASECDRRRTTRRASATGGGRRVRQATYDLAYATGDVRLGVYDIRRTIPTCATIRRGSPNTTARFGILYDNESYHRSF